MNILWYISVSAVFLSTAFAFSTAAENRRLKEQCEQQPEEQITVRRFRSIKA